MVIDHTRFLDISNEVAFGLFTVGRIAFPLFCFLLAYYFFRTYEDNNNTDSDVRYIRNLTLFTLISEIPYRLYGGLDFNQINIMFTLMLSFILIYSYARQWRSAYLEPSFITFLIVLLVLFLELTDMFKVQYGIGGVLLPLAMYLLLRYKKMSNWFFVSGCAVVMNFNFYEGQILNSLYIFVIHLVPVCISLIGALTPFFLIKTKIDFNVPPIKKWAYWFYPLHFIVLLSLRSIYRFFS